MPRERRNNRVENFLTQARLLDNPERDGLLLTIDLCDGQIKIDKFFGAGPLQNAQVGLKISMIDRDHLSVCDMIHDKRFTQLFFSKR